MDSIRCSKCNAIMVLQRSSDVDFIRESSRCNYKCSKTKCSNYCVKIFDSRITNNHDMNKTLISTKQHLLQQLPVGDEHTMIEDYKEFDRQLIEELKKTKEYVAPLHRQYDTKKILLRTNEGMIERVKIELEFDINTMIRLTAEDIQHALNEMFEQIDLNEHEPFDNNGMLNESQATQINNFKCEIWKQSL